MKHLITSLLILALLLTCTSCQSMDGTGRNSDLSIYLLDYDYLTKQSVEKLNSGREKGKVNIKIFNREDIQEYQDTLLSELSHGTGPDIIVLYPHYIENIAQYLNLDAFYNINELIQKDRKFNIADYDNRILSFHSPPLRSGPNSPQN